jgi:hypothetical protein
MRRTNKKEVVLSTKRDCNDDSSLDVAWWKKIKTLTDPKTIGRQAKHEGRHEKKVRKKKISGCAARLAKGRQKYASTWHHVSAPTIYYFTPVDDEILLEH